MLSSRRSLSAVAAGIAATWIATPALAGSVTGTVKFDGQAPSLRPLAMDADPVCAKKHDKPVPNEMLSLGSGNTMANVLVRVTGGLPSGKSYPAPKDPIVMDQKGCIYHPHVFAMQQGQKFKVLNSDGVLHNVHALPSSNAQFNMAMPPNRTEAEHVFDKAEETPFKIKCDVHPWMTAYTAVLTNPFYSVTKDDGKFSIADLPAGTYEIEAWHEKLGSKKEKVTVGDKDEKTVDFTFSAPK
jgi:plastocyanin